MFETICESYFIGFNALYRTIQSNPKISMAKQTLLKIVNELVEEGDVKKIRIKGKQNVQFCPTSEELDESIKNYQHVDKILATYEKKFSYLKEFSEKHSLDYVEDFATVIYRFAKTIWFLDWKCKSTFLHIEPELNQRLKRIDKLKKDLFDLAYAHDDIMTSVIYMVNNELTVDSNNESVSLEDVIDELMPE